MSKIYKSSVVGVSFLFIESVAEHHFVRRVISPQREVVLSPWPASPHNEHRHQDQDKEGQSPYNNTCDGQSGHLSWRDGEGRGERKGEVKGETKGEKLKVCHRHACERRNFKFLNSRLYATLVHSREQNVIKHEKKKNKYNAIKLQSHIILCGS